MSYQELYSWYDYYSEEPFLSDRLEMQLATLCHIAANFAGSKLKREDFMISNRKKETIMRTAEEQKEFEDSLKAKFMAFAKKEK